MNQALTYLYYIYDKFVNLIFNQLEIATNVSIGWILVSVTIFAMLIKNILNLPRSMSSFDKFREHSYYNVERVENNRLVHVRKRVR